MNASEVVTQALWPMILADMRFPDQSWAHQRAKAFADAAISALGLQQEWGVKRGVVIEAPLSEHAARERSERGRPAAVMARFVGPWRAAE